MTTSNLSPAQLHAIDVQQNIDRYGFSITAVIGDRCQPGYVYTTGFLSRGHPEILIIDLHPNSAGDFLHHLFDELCDGVTHAIGRDVDNQWRGTPFRLLPVPKEHWDSPESELAGIGSYYADKAIGFRETAAVQLIWPDRHGRLPWDPDVDMTVWRDQPVLADGHRFRRHAPLPPD